ncbi:MAG TPA: hypothetical protein VHC71_08770 [Hyphomicrobium sp.]|jgi:hypothetical protein|nr:hypothetical protein [Hyphomicrobium sp.]
MAGSIQETVPDVLKTLWNLENELRSAAQNSVILRREEAHNHLQQARHHLDRLLGLSRSSWEEMQGTNSSNSTITADDNKF